MKQDEELQQLEKQLNAAEGERRRLLGEIHRRREELKKQILPDLVGQMARPTAPTTSQEKIALFLDLFRCREDVYPRYWENASKGTRGYSPACGNEWVRGICDKPRIKCSECPHQKFPTLDESAVRKHLEGKEIVGTYAIRAGDTCRFIAADFDGDGFEKDALAYRRAAREVGIEVLLERSRSGRGAHAWVFFSEFVNAGKARQLGTALLSRANRDNPLFRLESYDRLFPNQDTLPRGGFGNLIALPLQRKARDLGNTAFVHETFQVIDEPWELLSKTRRLSAADLERLLAEILPPIAYVQDEIELDMRRAEAALDPGANDAEGFSGNVAIWQSNVLKIDTTDLPSRLVRDLKKTATLANPKFFELQRMRFSTWQTPRYIFCGEIRPPSTLILPRGSLDKALEKIAKTGGNSVVRDQRPRFDKMQFSFSGELRADQRIAVAALAKQDFGVLVAPPGAGKTVMACSLIAERELPTLVLVHRAPLLEQWVERIGEFLGIGKKDIGRITGTRKKTSGKLDIAMLQTLARAEDQQALLAPYGLIIVDECHHIPAATFEVVLRLALARSIVGLTATPYRKDGLQRILHMQAGPIRHEMSVSESSQLDRRLIVRHTALEWTGGDAHATPMHEIYEKIVADPGRNEMIATDVTTCVGEGRVPLVISERKIHLQVLRTLVEGMAPETVCLTLTGEMGVKARREVMAKVRECIAAKQSVCIFATGSLIGEGFDLPELDTLFVAMPGSFKGKVVQYAGRLNRSAPGKTEVRVYDYLDSCLAVTKGMFRKRMVAYRSMDYRTS